jgi:hypothetical protein
MYLVQRTTAETLHQRMCSTLLALLTLQPHLIESCITIIDEAASRFLSAALELESTDEQ